MDEKINTSNLPGANPYEPSVPQHASDAPRRSPSKSSVLGKAIVVFVTGFVFATILALLFGVVMSAFIG